jgi:uncharacterized delta-60 repeat protein
MKQSLPAILERVLPLTMLRSWRCAALMLMLMGAPETVLAKDESSVPGSIDTTFVPNVNGPITGMAVGSDGRIAISGGFTAVGGISRRGLARLHPDGTLDESFVPSTNAPGAVALTVLKDQRLLAAFESDGFSPSRVIAFSPVGKMEAAVNVEAYRVLFTSWHLLPDETPVLRYHAGNPGAPIFNLSYFGFQLTNNTLTATALNLAADPSLPRQSTGNLITTESEGVGSYGQVPSYVVLRRTESGLFDGSFRIMLGSVAYEPHIAVQTDDRLLVALPANFGPNGATNRPTLVRFRSDGTVDLSFPQLAFGRISSTANLISAVVLQPDNRVLVAGNFPSSVSVPRAYLARINLGESPPSAPPTIVAAPSPADALPGQTAVFRVNPDGIGPLRVQWLFQDQPLVGQTNQTLVLTNISAGAEGDYAVGVKNAAGEVRSAPAHLTVVPASGGSVDPGFDPALGAEDGQVNVLLLEPDGRILAGGTFTQFNGQPRRGLVRLNTDGSLDRRFEAGRATVEAESVAQLTVDALARQADGRILFGGTLQQRGAPARTNVYRLHSDGTLDASFQASPAHPPTILSLAVLPGNRVLLGGTFSYTNTRGIFFGDSFRNLVRLTPEGNLDRTFNPQVNANQSGSFPVSWSLLGNVRAMALAGEEKLLVAGAFEPKGLGSSFARLNSDGSRDGTFQPRIYLGTDEIGRGGVPTLTAMALDSGGDSAIAGYFLVAGANKGVVAGSIARFTKAGHLTGQIQSTPSSGVNAMAFQKDGKLLVAGLFDAQGTPSREHLRRFHADGTVDISFGGPGKGPNNAVLAIVPEPTGAILIGGKFSSVDGVNRRGIARLYGSGRVFRELIHPHRQGPTFSASIQTIAGKRYTLERAPSLVSPVWSAVTNLDGNGSVKEFRDAASGFSERFYRVRIE